jgi:hypothetical protein
MSTQPPSPHTAGLQTASLQASQPIACWVGQGGEAIAAELASDAPVAGERTAREARTADAPWGVRLVAIGGERRSLVTQWASRAAIDEIGSLRELARVPAAIRLVLGGERPGDADLEALLGGDAIVVTTAPTPATTSEAFQLGDIRSRIRTIPLFRWSEAFRVAEPMLAEFLAEGRPTAVAIRLRHGAPDRATAASVGHATQAVGVGGLSSLLLDAADLAAEFAVGIESVFAMERTPVLPGEPPAMHAVARSGDGAILSLELIAAGGFERSVMLTGPGGTLAIGDALLERRDQSGSILERIDRTPPADAVAATLESLRTLIRLRGGREDPGRVVTRLAIVDAARLSARTGNAESPASVEAIAARP